jgi:hypothetical protein
VTAARKRVAVAGAFLVVAVLWAALRTVYVVVGLAGTAFLAAFVLARLPRLVAAGLALAGVAGAVVLALALHEDLRGERPDPGPDPETAAQATPPLDARSGALEVAVWGDCRGGASVQERLFAQIRSRRPALSIGLGDLVGMARTYQFEILRRKLLATGVPFLVLPGNHDLDPFGTLRPYGRVFGPRNWWFRALDHGALFVGLDTARGVLEPADVAWAEGIVRGRAAGVRHVLLFCHHPLYPPTGRVDKPLPDDDATRRLRALAQETGARVFASHFHAYDERVVERVTQVVTGGAGSRLESDDPYHYVRVTIDDDGVRSEPVVLARAEDVSPTLDRLLVFRDEAGYAAFAFPARASAVLLCLALLPGALLSGLFRARRGIESPAPGPTA